MTDGNIMDFPLSRTGPLPGRPWRSSLGGVVDRLRQSREETHNIRHEGRIRHLPSAKAVAQVVEKLAAALFPTHYGDPTPNPDVIDDYVDYTLADALDGLTEQVLRDIRSASRDGEPEIAHAEAKADAIVTSFAETLPTIRNLIVSDLMAAFAGDPAATSYPEIMLGYPGMTAILHYRLARALYRLDATLVARLISQAAHAKTAIDIHPGAAIGDSFFIDHGTGVVIGETAIIGNRVRLYQAVTLGARSFAVDGDGRLVKGQPRHPIIEDDVVIYAGATVLGRITVGHHAVIGGNVWLTDDVPPHSSVTQARMRTSGA
ncbi:serine acetyltransferase [Lichenihabitans sp. Uapishka_5]|uniref:serine O-acetyltransferase EpsC n=1 Tax=Lichenihabitans sp. Uapishka_5 TaxID=3037302 RepID=UPI0029E7D496|nr:serine O-acetyltransferase EpsC [Lichenihabitans sp. Uapishka_5]MDX7953295.1 serine acetyltransferase [Lichenihabitans sp. Uapishka_5]